MFRFRQAIVKSLTSHQFVVLSRFDNPTTMQNTNQIGVLDRRETVSNDNARSAFRGLVECFLNNTFTLTVQGTLETNRESKRDTSDLTVASSSNNTFGFRIRARAMATREAILRGRATLHGLPIRCFSPPDSCVPFEPTFVSYLSGNDSMNRWMFALLTA